MLTGLFPPTSGTAYVSGYDVTTENAHLTTLLGFCPQHDVLFEHMTVLEHLQFFAKVKAKGMSSVEVKLEVTRSVHVICKMSIGLYIY